MTWLYFALSQLLVYLSPHFLELIVKRIKRAYPTGKLSIVLADFCKEIRECLIHNFRLIDIHTVSGIRNDDVIGARNAARHIV